MNNDRRFTGIFRFEIFKSIFADDVAAGLEDLVSLGFSGFQLEVFHRESLNTCARTGASQIWRKSSDLGLEAHQFVAHFMLADFADRQSLVSNAATEHMKAVLDIEDRFDECRVITVSSPAFDGRTSLGGDDELFLIPAELGPRILGTHLCDNFGSENLSLRPGAGSIDWPRLRAALKDCGCNGTLDIEIVCQSDGTLREYGEGRMFIETILRRP